MRSFLLKPYPFAYSISRKLRICAGIGLFVALFLALFKPFGIHSLSSAQQWQHPLLFGLVTFVASSLLQIGLPRLLPRPFAEAHWKSWKELLFLFVILLFVAAGNYWLMRMLYHEGDIDRSFLNVLLITAQVGIFPLVAIVFMKQLLLYRRYAAAAQAVNQELEKPEIPAPELREATNPAQSIVVLQGEGQKERLELPANDLRIISSSDNYVRVFFLKQGTTGSQLLRSSLKNIEQQLASHPQLFRCHRMHLVNLDGVVQVSGNAQGLRLHLQGVEEPIPVSRSLTQTVKERLAHLSHSPQMG